MRESIGGAWIFGLVAVFIVMFSSFLAISINYSKAFKVKDDIISIIEKSEGHNRAARELIERYLDGAGYNIYGYCSENEIRGVPDPYSKQAKYCVESISSNNEIDKIPYKYYRVRVFFRLDLPVFGRIFTFSVPGESKPVYYATDK